MLSLLLTVAIGVVTPVEDPIPATEAYPLDICAVAGKKLGSMGKPIDFVHEGRQVRFCCRGCVPKFKANPDQYLAEVDKKIIAAQKKNYPVDYCLLSNEKLDEDAKEVVIKNRLVRLCCGGCAKKIKKNPEPTFTQLDSAIKKKQGKSYPLTTCVISGKDLGGTAKDIIVGNTLIKVCCKGCISKVTGNPSKYIQMVGADKKAGAKDKKKAKTKKPVTAG
ncbi:MAG: hypothetical protein VYD70_04695 [Planctomycetota bacterium]|nr:hypothetical protein [Planctomycetota bacterium]